MTTALEVGLVSGFALQDGDRIAQLLGGAGGGGFSLGSAGDVSMDLGSSGNNNIVGAVQIISAITVVTTATATNNSVQLASVGVFGVLRIFNRSTTNIYVFPPTGQSVDLVTTGPVPINGSVTLIAGGQCDYAYLGNGQWISDLLGSSSA